MSNSVSETSLSGDIGRYLRYQLRGRRGLIVAAAAVGIPALWIGWPWLVVAGLAPILIAIAPCAIMCALGLCAMKAGAKADSGEASSNISRSETSCCSQSPATDETIAALPGKEDKDAPAVPVSIVVPSDAELNSAEPESEPHQAGDVRLPAGPGNQGKEKFQ
jgi:hypothetical protein